MTVRHFQSYGGRKGRYKYGPVALVGLFDPWERRSLEFRGVWVKALWLLRRADVDVQSIELRPPRLRWLYNGELLQVQADLKVVRSTGVTYEVAADISSPSTRRKVELLQVGARLRRADWNIVGLDELEAHARLIDAMSVVRQTLAMWLDHDLSVASLLIQSQLLSGPLSRAELRQRVHDALGPDGAAAADAAIFRLYFGRKVAIALADGWEDGSVVAGR